MKWMISRCLPLFWDHLIDHWLSKLPAKLGILRTWFDRRLSFQKCCWWDRLSWDFLQPFSDPNTPLGVLNNSSSARNMHDSSIFLVFLVLSVAPGRWLCRRMWLGLVFCPWFHSRSNLTHSGWRLIRPLLRYRDSPQHYLFECWDYVLSDIPSSLWSFELYHLCFKNDNRWHSTKR